MTAVANLHPSRVTVADGTVHIRDLTCTDTDLVSLATSAADPEEAVQRALATGARVLTVATASIDTAVVERSFDRLTTQMTALLSDTAGQVSGQTSALFDDPDNGMRVALRDWMTDVSTVLNETFDPDRSSSALGKLQVVLRDSGDAQLSATRRMLNPDAEDSPLSRLAASMRDQVATVLDAVARLAEQVSAERAATVAERRALERSAVKGQSFEETVGREVARIASGHGDAAEPVGRTSGVTGGRVGDYVVTLPGGGGSYVLECKDRSVSVRAILAELDKAAANRESGAAIAVFSSIGHSPVNEQLAIFDDKVLVVFDKDDPDPQALRLACAWARAITLAHAASDGAEIPLDAIRRVIDEARRALDRVSAIRRAHTSAARKIAEAGDHVTTLSLEITGALERIELLVAD